MSVTSALFSEKRVEKPSETVRLFPRHRFRRFCRFWARALRFESGSAKRLLSAAVPKRTRGHRHLSHTFLMKGRTMKAWIMTAAVVGGLTIFGLNGTAEAGHGCSGYPVAAPVYSYAVPTYSSPTVYPSAYVGYYSPGISVSVGHHHHGYWGGHHYGYHHGHHGFHGHFGHHGHHGHH